MAGRRTYFRVERLSGVKNLKLFQHFPKNPVEIYQNNIYNPAPMGINHAEPGYTDKATPFIQEDGGKIGGLRFINAKVPELADLIPNTVIVRPDQDGINEIPFDTDVIVRASHKNDFQGLVDVLPTIVVKAGPNIIERINEAIQEIREICKYKEVMEYGKYENPDFDGNVVIGIQPFFDFPIGSIMEHPNRPGHYIVSHVYKANTNGSRLLNRDGEELDDYTQYSLCSHKTNKSRKIIEMYRKIQLSGLVREDLVPQVEFGDEANGDGLKLLQIRAGVKKEIAKFKLDKNNPKHIALVIGVTEGMELPILHGGNWGEGERDISNGQSPYAFMRTYHGHRPSLSFMPRAMSAYLANLSFGSGYPGLEHNQFSLIQKAQVSVFESKWMCTFRAFDKSGDILAREDETPKIPEGMTGDKVRIISDGIHAIIELIK